MKIVVNSQYRMNGTTNVLRGGSFNGLASFVRSANRFNFVPTFSFINYGFRIVLVKRVTR